jgi:hypothetical protein
MARFVKLQHASRLRGVALKQHAELHGRNNTVIQIQGDGNTIVPSLPHLTLTRYLTRRGQIASEADLLSPYGMTIPMAGREAQMADLHHWMTSGPSISIRVLTGQAGSGKTRMSVTVLSRVRRHASSAPLACIWPGDRSGGVAPGGHGTASSHGDHGHGSS